MFVSRFLSGEDAPVTGQICNVSQELYRDIMDGVRFSTVLPGMDQPFVREVFIRELDLRSYIRKGFRSRYQLSPPLSYPLCLP